MTFDLQLEIHGSFCLELYSTKKLVLDEHKKKNFAPTFQVCVTEVTSRLCLSVEGPWVLGSMYFKSEAK